MDTGEIKYWETFYKEFNVLSPSPFAKFILEYFQNADRKSKLLDLGCGNGRDSYYLSSKFITTGIDISNVPKETQDCQFLIGDMVTFDKTGFDIIYMRFTFHSINDTQQEKLISSIQPNTILCIETRSIKSLNSYRLHGDGHYRNLTSLDTLLTLLNVHNFEILYSLESDGLAIYKEEDPICIRVICKKLGDPKEA